MHHRPEEEEEKEEVEESSLDSSYWSDHQMMSDTSDEGTDLMVSVADYLAASVGDYLKATLKTQVMEEEEAPEPRLSICNYCGKGFKSSKALGGHLRIHSQNHAKSSESQVGREHSPKKQVGYFGCFSCKESFSAFHLLAQHTAIHRNRDSNPVRGPVVSQESVSETTFKQGIDTTVSVLRNDHKIDLPKVDISVNQPSQTSKIGLKRRARDDNIIQGAVAPSRVYTESQMETRKKNTENSMAYQDTSVDNKSESKRSRKKAKSVKSQVHQCEICGKVFESGQALGGHKTKHRVKELLPEETHLSQEAADQNHPKRMLDIDLNIPYEESS